MRTSTLLRGLPFIAVQVGCTLGFFVFANWTDTGRWGSDGWQAIAASGLVCATLLYAAEARRYDAPGALRRRWLVSVLRATVLSIVCMAFSFAMGLFGMMIAAGGNWLVLGLLVVPLTTVLLLPAMIPFGILSGFLETALLSIRRASTDVASVPT